MVRETVTHHMC